MDYKKEVGVFLLGMCIRECLEKDVGLKPVFCTAVCTIGSYYGIKATYEGASIIYDKSVKPALKSFLASRRFGKDLPGLPPQK